MKAITVLQPWATLLATGKKHIETRSWKTNYRGEIFIHAGKKDPLVGICMMTDDAKERAFRALGLPETFNRFQKFPTGEILGKANLVNCLLIDEETARLIKEQNPDEYAFGDFTPGRYAWVMENVVIFKEPIPVSGKQGLWNWDGELGQWKELEEWQDL